MESLKIRLVMGTWCVVPNIYEAITTFQIPMTLVGDVARESTGTDLRIVSSNPAHVHTK